MHRHLKHALRIAPSTKRKDQRNFRLGAVGVRSDGVLVTARNGEVVGTQQSTKRKYSFPKCHAERRCAAKMDKGGTIYVGRVRSDGSIGNARPCRHCQVYMKSRGIAKVVYTIGPEEWGTLSL